MKKLYQIFYLLFLMAYPLQGSQLPESAGPRLPVGSMPQRLSIAKYSDEEHVRITFGPSIIIKSINPQIQLQELSLTKIPSQQEEVFSGEGKKPLLMTMRSSSFYGKLEYKRYDDPTNEIFTFSTHPSTPYNDFTSADIESLFNIWQQLIKLSTQVLKYQKGDESSEYSQKNYYIFK